MAIPKRDQVIDFILLFVSLSLVFTSGFFLFFSDVTETTDKEKLELLATAKIVTKEVKRKRPASLSWYPVLNGSELFKDDLLFVADNSSVSIEFLTKEQIDIGPESLVRLFAPSQDAGGIKIINGVVDVKLAKRKFKVNIANKEVEIAPSEGRIKAIGLGGEGKIKVEEGKIALKVGNKDVGFDEDSILSFEEKSKKFTVTKSSIGLIYPKDGEEIHLGGGRSRRILFKWRGREHHREFRFQLSYDKDFEDLYRETTLESSGIQVTAPEVGKYYWRVFPLFKGKPIIDVNIIPRSFSVVDNIQIRPISPTNGKTFFFGQNETGANTVITWQKADVPRYMIEVEHESGKVDLLNSKTSRIRYLARQEGGYRWRVRGVRYDGVHMPWSTYSEFSASKSSGGFEISLVRPVGQEEFDISESTFKSSVGFEYKVDGKTVEDFKVVVFSNTNLSKPLVQKTLRDGRGEIEFTKAGKYAWGVFPQGTTDFKRRALGLARFKVRLPPPVVLNAKEIYKVHQRSNITVKWSLSSGLSSGVKTRFFYQMAKDKEFTQILQEGGAYRNSKDFSGLAKGKYFFRVQFSSGDIDGRYCDPVEINLVDYK